MHHWKPSVLAQSLGMASQVLACSAQAARVVNDRADVSWHAKVVSEMLHTFMVFFQILDGADIFLTDDQAQRATVAGRANLILYQYLAEDSFNRQEHMWKLRPKLPCIMHVVEALSEKFENPCNRDASAWEDFVGRALNNAGTTLILSAAKRVAQRWLLLLAHNWHRRRHF